MYVFRKTHNLKATISTLRCKNLEVTNEAKYLLESKLALFYLWQSKVALVLSGANNMCTYMFINGMEYYTIRTIHFLWTTCIIIEINVK